MTANHPSTGSLVVVGASAGGIEALSILVGSLPTDFPAPVVLAQHLDPKRPSFLASVLERRTTLPVVGVEGLTTLEPGKVYVVPSNRHVVIQDGHVNLQADHADRPRPSVDLLLSTAAASYGERLVAVILTGAGSDGAAGAVDVKDAGGVVVIQNPQTARYPSMPMALPPTAVDHVVDIEKIGALLNDLMQGEARVTLEPKPDEDALRHVTAILSRQANIDFRPYKPATLLRRIGRRMFVTHSHNLEEYAHYLEAHPEEVGELVMTLLIKVTEFFRDPEAFTLLHREVVPQLLEAARERGRLLRLWSAGCATGEEAYSLALVVADLLGPEMADWTIKIFATDLDESAVAFARRGLYPPNVLKKLPPEYLSRYFEAYDQGYRINKSLRQLVIFGQQDLSRGVPFPRIDLAVCRNLLIYFKPALQQDVLDLFAYSLQQTHGYLFLGKAETARPSKPSFELVNKRWKIYRCLSGPSSPRQSAAVFTANGAAREDPQARPGGAGEVKMMLVEPELAHLRRYNELVNRHVPLGIIVVDRGYQIITINPAARRLLGIRAIANDEDFLHTTRALPYAEMRRAIDIVLRERTANSLPPLPLDPAVKAECTHVSLHFSPLIHAEGREYALVTVVDASELVQVKTQLDALTGEHRNVMEELGTTNSRLGEMNKDLQDSNEELQAANEELMLAQEELQATNEEFEATNEELQASNEELETNNEELQATNEELEATNEELQARTSELQELTRILSSERTRLGEVVELSPFYTLVLTGAAQVVESSSPSAGGLFGGPEVVGRRFEDLCRQPELRGLMEGVRQVHRDDRTWTSDSVRTPTTDPSGHTRTRELIFTVVPTHDTAGKVDGAVIYGEDVTLRKARDEEQQRERLKLMMEHAAQVALALFDARTRALLHASPRYLELVHKAYDSPRESPLGRPWEELSLLGVEAGDLCAQVRDSGKPMHLKELRVISPRGETFWDCSVIPISREGGRSGDVRYVVVSAVEVTAQVEKRAALEEVDRLKDQFLSLASHELRTPLVPLRTYTEILSRRAESVGDTELASIVSKFEKQILHLTRLTDDLLDVARLENGKLSLEQRPVDLRQTAREAAGRLTGAHPEIEVRLELSEAPAVVLADEDRVVQILSNLLENAVQHGRSPRVDLRVRGDGNGQAAVEVEDYGIGIPKEEQDSIFDRLQQASLPQRASRPGLGLGLFIARELVEQHGGELLVSSEVGKGSLFTVRLPLYAEP